MLVMYKNYTLPNVKKIINTGMKEGSERIETYVILGCKLRKCMSGFSTFSFCEELWPKQNNTQFIWVPYNACVQNSVSGS